jgi:hypothetical protein
LIDRNVNRMNHGTLHRERKKWERRGREKQSKKKMMKS